MEKKRLSIDGLRPRKSGAEVGEHHRVEGFIQANPERRELRSAADAKEGDSTVGKYDPARAIGRTEIDELVDSLPDEPEVEVPKKRRWPFGRKAGKKKRSKKRRIITTIIVVLVVAILAVGGYFAYKVFNATGRVFNGSIVDIFKDQRLKEDANGRSNFLVLGTTDDDPNHPGNNLTDTIIIVSVDQDDKNAYMFSVPRDLYVNYGMACPAGYSGKINSYFSCVNTGTTAADEQDRLVKAEKFIGNILGMDIQYGVHVNSVVVRDAVNAVGGVDVDVEGSNGAPGVLDRNFDWICNYTCYKVKYTNGVHHLNGEQAMYLAMARGDTAPTYGLSRSNFDREQNQQKIIKALKAKATSTGFLTNLSSVTKLIDAVGKNLRTNVQTSEIRTLMDLANKIPSSSIYSIDFMKQSPPLFTTGNMGSAGSVVYPLAGVGQYAELQAFIKQQLNSDPLVREAAHVIVLNASGVSGQAQKQADKLSDLGMTVDLVGNAPSSSKKGVNAIYQVASEAKSATAAKLKSLYGVEPVTTKVPAGITVGSDTDYVIVIGKDMTSSDQ